MDSGLAPFLYQRLRLALIGIMPAVLCGMTLLGCFTARWYVPPAQELQYRVFDDYLIEIHVGNRTYSTYDYKKNDFDYHVIARVQTDSLLPEIDSGQVVRIERLCISGECLTHVYCPPCSRDTIYGRVLTTEGVVNQAYYPNYYDCGWVEIPEKCLEITITFDAVLTDTLADTVIAAERVSLSLDRRHSKIPAIMPI